MKILACNNSTPRTTLSLAFLMDKTNIRLKFTGKDPDWDSIELLIFVNVTLSTSVSIYCQIQE